MKNIFLSLLLFFSVNFSLACDICGLYAEINPNDYKNTIGFYYRSRLASGVYSMPQNGFHLKHGSNSEKGKYIGKELREIYNVYELRASVFFKERFQLIYSQPFVNNYRSVNGYTDFDIYGWGDPVILFNSILWATSSVSKSSWKHRINAGAGVKAPLGSIEKSYFEIPADLDLQPGSGSWDGIFNLDYSVRKVTGIGFQMNYIYRMNGYNTNNMAYGNFLNMTHVVFYRKNWGNKLTFMPSFGVYIENSGKDKENREVVEESGGTTMMSHTGLDVFVGKFRLFAAWHMGFYHQYKSDLLPVRDRWIAGIVYNFNWKK